MKLRCNKRIDVSVSHCDCGAAAIYYAFFHAVRFFSHCIFYAFMFFGADSHLFEPPSEKGCMQRRFCHAGAAF